jgi:hypothetical protein
MKCNATLEDLPHKMREGAISNWHAGDITKWRLHTNGA